MSHSILERADTFIWKNARLLERQQYLYHFKDGAEQNVISALIAYQNSDGGFGNALEPDIRCPDSQPVPVQHALEILDRVSFDLEIVQSICDYLMTITTSEGGVPWLLPSAHQYPRAPWWSSDEPAPASLNPTAAIAGLLHKNKVEHPWLESATNYCWAMIDKLQPSEMHEAGVALTFLYHVPERERAERALARLFREILAAGLVADAHDTGYSRKPLDWAPTPNHPFRAYFRDEEIKAHLDAIVAEQDEDGGWHISWPPLSPGCNLEWRGWVTLEKLRLLQANGVLAY